MYDKKGWTCIKVNDVAELLRGITYKKNQASNIEEKGYKPVLRSNNIYGGALNFDKLVYVSSDLIKNEQYIKKGDIIFAMSSGSKHLVGKSAPAKYDIDGSYGAFCALLRIDTNIPTEYISFFFQGNEFRKLISNIAKGTNINNLKRKHILDFEIPFPPLPEQRAIISKIEQLSSDLDNGIDNFKKAQEQLKRYHQSVLKAACEGRLVPTEAELARAEGRDYEAADVLLARILKERHENWNGKGKYKDAAAPDKSGLPELPEGWVWTTINQLAASEAYAITDGPFGSNLKTSHYTEMGPRVIRLQNIGDGLFNNAYAHISQQHYDSLSKHRVQAGDLVIAALGEHPPRACIIPPSVGPAIVKADCIRFKPDNELALNIFLNCALNSEPTRTRTACVIHGMGRPRLNLGEIKSILLSLPPLTEQRRIVTEVERRLSVSDKMEETIAESLQKSEALRQSILKKAFEGKLLNERELRESRNAPDWEPAEKLLERIKAGKKISRKEK